MTQQPCKVDVEALNPDAPAHERVYQVKVEIYYDDKVRTLMIGRYAETDRAYKVGQFLLEAVSASYAAGIGADITAERDGVHR